MPFRQDTALWAFYHSTNAFAIHSAFSYTAARGRLFPVMRGRGFMRGLCEHQVEVPDELLAASGDEPGAFRFLAFMETVCQCLRKARDSKERGSEFLQRPVGGITLHSGW